MNARLWIVGMVIPEGDHFSWEFMGVFDSEEKAIAACTWECWIGPANLNEALPVESSPWPGQYYPLARAAGVEGY